MVRTIRVDTHAEQGTFRGWGTSLAWWANGVGRQPAAFRDEIVRRIFGADDDCLAMNVARFNAGGGENPGVELTMDRRAVMDGYRTAPDAEFDENADPGQRAVLREAARLLSARGEELLVEVFGNSPPWWATVSGSVTGASDESGLPAPNLSAVFERDYLHYLVDVAEFLERDTGVTVRSISPFNEPASAWWRFGGRQEGCHFTPEGIDTLLTHLAEESPRFAERAVSATEDWSLEQALTSWDTLGPTARRTVGQLNTHTYDGASRAALRARAARAGVELWVSEFGEGGPLGYELATAIVRDLRGLAPAGWVLWQAVSQDAWGLLVCDPAFTRAHAAPKFEVMARFARTIRPGMRLVGCDDIGAVAAADASGDRVAVVVVGEPSVAREVCVQAGAGVAGAREASVTIAAPSADGRAVSVTRVQVASGERGEIAFELPAGAVASVEVALATGDDRARDAAGFLGSGTWWLEHESGARLELDADAASSAELEPGVRVRAAAADERALAQRWRAESCGEGSVRWICEASGMALDVARASRRVGAHVVQWPCALPEATSLNQRWQVRELGEEGWVALVSAHSGRALALDARGLGEQRRLGDDSTRWRLVRARTARSGSNNG